jgi:hypothetical protein
MPPTALRTSLLAWASQVFASAGLTSTPEREREIAGTIAHLIMSERLVPFAAANGVSEFFAGWHGAMDVRHANVLEHIDGARSILIVMIADKRLGVPDGPERAGVEHEIAQELDATISAELASSRDEFVRGVSEEFGSAQAGQESTRASATTGAVANSGCLVAVLTMTALAAMVASSRQATDAPTHRHVA